MIKDYRPEILSPAGTLSCLKAGVGAGADAVYFGGRAFNARKNAGNFDKDQIAEAVRLCRLFGVRTHLTVNTCVKEKEWDDLKAYLSEVLPLGIDAVIVQDPGVASYVAKHFPEIELHGSTQMAVSSLEGVRLLEDLGFKRVVLARELSLSDIEYIRARTGMELEVFIHGALCYSYSGRCLLSSFHGGRSGNRGACAQPCRLSYTCELAADPSLPPVSGYLLNLKDREGYSSLQELMDLGIDSFKIEGRMKSEAYVSGVTAFYQRLKRAYMETGRVPEPSKEELEELLQLFNRGGFTDGYFRGKDGMIDLSHPKHQGIIVGKVTGTKGSRITIEGDRELHAGDELEIGSAQVRLSASMLLDARHAGFYLKSDGKIQRGTPVRRIVDPALHERLLAEGSKFPTIPLRIRGTVRKKEPMSWSAEARGQIVMLTGPEPMEALKSPSDRETVKRQMERLGDTPFSLTELELSIENGLFIPASTLNHIRRELTAALEEKIVSTRIGRGTEGALHRESRHFPEEEGAPLRTEICVQNRAQLEAAVRWYEEKRLPQPVYALAMEGWEKEDKASVLQYLTPERLMIVLPGVCRDRDEARIRQEIRQWRSLGVEAFEASLPGQIGLIERMGGDLLIGPDMGIWNKQALDFWAGRAKRVCFSRELSIREVRDLKGLDGLSLLIYGWTPYMVTEQCPVKTCYGCRKKEDSYRLLDRRGEKIRGYAHCGLCYNVFYAENPVCLPDRAGYLRRIQEGVERRPAQGLRVEFVPENGNKVRQVLDYLWKDEGVLPWPVGEGHFRKEVM